MAQALVFENTARKGVEDPKSKPPETTSKAQEGSDQKKPFVGIDGSASPEPSLQTLGFRSFLEGVIKSPPLEKSRILESTKSWIEHTPSNSTPSLTTLIFRNALGPSTYPNSAAIALPSINSLDASWPRLQELQIEHPSKTESASQEKHARRMELLITGAGATALMAAVIGSLILAKGTEASSLHIFLGAAIVPIAAAFGLAIRRTHQHRYPAQKGEEVRPMLESILDFIASMLPKSSS